MITDENIRALDTIARELEQRGVDVKRLRATIGEHGAQRTNIAIDLDVAAAALDIAGVIAGAAAVASREKKNDARDEMTAFAERIIRATLPLVTFE